MKIFDTMKLEKVSNEDVDFLYKMLGERDESVNITHKKKPSYEMHKKCFLETNPYDGWFIMLEAKKTGNIWIEDNNDIGWFIKKEFQNLGIPIKAFEILKKLHKRDFYIGKNNPKNIRACRLLEKMGFTLKNTSVNGEMITYELNECRN